MQSSGISSTRQESFWRRIPPRSSRADSSFAEIVHVGIAFSSDDIGLRINAAALVGWCGQFLT